MAESASYSLPANLRVMLDGVAATCSATQSGAAEQRWVVTLMQRHGPGVVSALWRMLGREDDVLDVYQSVVCRLASRGPQGIQGNRAAYFYRSAMNGAVSLLRKRKREREGNAQWAREGGLHQGRAEAGQDPSQAMERRQTVDAVRTAISELPDYLREVVVLRDLVGLEYRQIARTLGITCGTARVYRRKAVVRLAQALAEPSPTGQEEVWS